MLKIMNNLPDNVLGVSAEGKITEKDYETVLIHAITNALFLLLSRENVKGVTL